ncbi:MAG: hypothetical protein LC637_05795 [Xanthomonadaceae bacterium]|nr:hypothetical protein [Xanthomonadaceae bacterium]
MNKRIMSIFALTAAMLLASCAAMTNAELQESRQLDLDAQQLSEMHIDVGAGSLSVRGTADSDRVHVTAEVWQVKASDEYVLNLVRDGKRAVLEADIDFGGGRLSDSDNRIDLIVSVPEQLQLDIRDGSGSIVLDDVRGDVRIEDGSGSIKARNLGGALEIVDGSGSMSVINVLGDIKFNDGSGSISVQHGGGNLDIRDGSGSITVKDIAGVVRINDGSGSILVQRTGGNLDIRDGSGSITVQNAAGVVRINDESGSISVDGAADFELLSDGSGSVNLRNIGVSNEQRTQ